MAHLADMPEVAEQFIKLGDLRVRLLRAGRGPALVLIHGLLGYSFSWRHAIPILAKDREVFAIDMPGSGFSDCGDALDGHLAAAAQRLSGVLETLSIQRCDLVGSSYGGATALRFATLYPQRVRSLVLVSPANPWSRIGRKRLAAFRVPGFGQTFSKVARHLSPLHGFFIGRMYGNRALLSEQTVQGYSMVIARKGVLSHGTRITRSWREDMSELQAEMPKVRQIPALLVWGSKDRLVDIRSARPLAQNFQNGKIVVIPGAGHLPYEEVPNEFCLPVLDFLTRYSPLLPSSGK